MRLIAARSIRDFGSGQKPQQSKYSDSLQNFAPRRVASAMNNGDNENFWLWYDTIAYDELTALNENDEPARPSFETDVRVNAHVAGRRGDVDLKEVYEAFRAFGFAPNEDQQQQQEFPPVHEGLHEGEVRDEAPQQGSGGPGRRVGGRGRVMERQRELVNSSMPCHKRGQQLIAESLHRDNSYHQAVVITQENDKNHSHSQDYGGVLHINGSIANAADVFAAPPAPASLPRGRPPPPRNGGRGRGRGIGKN